MHEPTPAIQQASAIWPIAPFRCAAELSRYRGITDMTGLGLSSTRSRMTVLLTSPDKNILSHRNGCPPSLWEVAMFEVDRLVADCRAAFAADSTHKAICEVLARAMSEPAAVLRGLGEPNRAEIRKLFHSDSLTILNVVWAPGMMVMPHNHRMWAVIGIYSGREDNIFWRRIPGAPSRIEAAGAKSLCERDAMPLGSDIIHSVINPIDRLTGAIHIYGGDFFVAERSEWDSLTLDEHHSDGEQTRRTFERANARYEASLRAAPG